MKFMIKQKKYLMKKFNMKKNIYIIWIWWIWTSAIARYYNEKWYNVYWSDKNKSNLIDKLIEEWIKISIWDNIDYITNNIDLLVYSEAINDDNKELIKAKEIGINIKSYPQSLAEIWKNKKMIAISGTHWKSTTTSLTSLIFKNSEENYTSIVWTLLKEFDWKNFYKQEKNNSKNEYLIIEACEYKKSFHNYNPYILSILNIEADHLDFYKNEQNYIDAYKDMLGKVEIDWYVIIDWQDKNSKELIWKRKDIKYVIIENNYYYIDWQKYIFPKLNLFFPWDHILYDSRVSYIIWKIIWIEEKKIIEAIENYKWVWRRMEHIWTTKNNNIVISDYAHHPTEIKKTLKTIKEKYKWKQILTVFQAHQYSRTIELLNDFINSFNDTDKLIISNIYESRDSNEDKKKINSQIFTEKIIHDNKQNWENLQNTEKLIKDFDNNNKNSIIVLMWAWDIDSLRSSLKYKN